MVSPSLHTTPGRISEAYAGLASPHSSQIGSCGGVGVVGAGAGRNIYSSRVRGRYGVRRETAVRFLDKEETLV